MLGRHELASSLVNLLLRFGLGQGGEIGTGVALSDGHVLGAFEVLVPGGIDATLLLWSGQSGPLPITRTHQPSEAGGLAAWGILRPFR